MNAIRRLLLLTGLLLAGLFLGGCDSQLIYPTSTPWPTRTPRPTRTIAPTVTLTPTITPTPTEIIPSQAGTALPTGAAVIDPDNAHRLALFGRWGSGIPQAVAFSPDGSLVALASTRGLYLYDSENLALQHHIDPGMALRSLAFAPDGSLAAGGDDGRILIYNPASGELMHAIAAHRGPVFTLAFSENGDRLVSGGWDDAVRLWRWQEERELMSFDGHTSPPRSVSFSPDGETLYSWSPDDQLRIWPLSGRNPPEPIYLGIDPRRKSGSSAGFSSTGEFFAVDQDVRVRLLFTRTGNTRIMLTNFPQPVERVTVAPDGSYVATSNREGIRVWNGQNGQMTAEFEPGAGWNGALLAFSPDGSQLVSASDAVRLWSLEGPEEAVAVSPTAYQNGYRLFSGTAPDGEFIWNGLAGGQMLPLRLADGALMPVTGTMLDVGVPTAISADGSLAAAAGADRSISIWNTASGAPVATLTGLQQTPLSLAFSPDGSRVAAASGEAVVRVWGVESGDLAAELGASGSITQVSFSPDGNWLAGGSRLQTHLWQVDNWQLQETLPGRGLVFYDDSRLTARFVDDGTGETRVVLSSSSQPPLTLDANGSALAFSPAGDLLVVSGIYLSVFDVSSAKPLLMIDSPAPYGRALFALDGRKLLLTAPDGVAFVYAVP
jgi:WD40 repeat protein